MKKSFLKSVNDRIQILLRKTGIFGRLNTAFILLLTGTSTFLIFFSFYKYSAEIEDNHNRYISLLTQNVAANIEDKMSEYEKTALSFYDDEYIVRALIENSMYHSGSSNISEVDYENNTDYIQSKLFRIRNNRKDIVNVQFVTPYEQYYMIEAKGFRRGATIRGLQEFYQSDFYLVPQEKKGYPVWFDSKEQITTFYKTEQSIYGIPDIMTLCIAVYAPSDRSFLGVLVMNIELSAFSGAMDDYGIHKEDGNTFLIGKDGVLLWFDPSLAAPAFPNSDVLFEEFQEGKSGVIQKNIDGEKIILSYKNITRADIFVVHIVETDVLFGNIYHIRNLCIGVLIGTVIVGVLIAHYVTKSISDPVKSLVKVMRKTGDGKWNERYINSGKDEITILGDCFNEMADKTNQLIQEVYLSEIRRQEIALNWKNAQLDALSMQINPHFLYNTLDIIRWEAMYEANGESPVTDMLEKFSRLCRMGMKAGTKTVPLQKGIEHAEIYLEVINFRHQEKIELKTDIMVNPEKIYVPQFMLQPILENAVVHAFGNASDGFCIQITAREEEQNLVIHVIDNGKGMTPEECNLLRQKIEQNEMDEGSIGLGNINQRIGLYYGKRYGITIKSEENEGTDICITLPIREYSEDITKMQREED